MKVLIAYASRHGATEGIAERIGTALLAHGIESQVRPVTEVDDLAGFDAFVIGGAVYMFHWLKEATSFVRRHQAVLAQQPVWLFSSGPLGSDLVDGQGRDLLELGRPKEFGQLSALVHPRGERVFFGAYDPDAPAVGLGERLLKKMSAPKEGLPVGDFRDWAAIDAWAADIAAELRAGAVAAAG